MKVKKFTSIFLIFLCLPVYSKPLITIEKTDFGAHYPVMTVELNLEKADPDFLRDFTGDNLSVYEDGQKIHSFMLHDVSDPSSFLYVIFSIDSSKSINKENFQLLKKNAITIVKKTGKGENIGLSQFDDEVKEISNFTSDKDKIITRIEGLRQQGKKTLLYNAIFNSLQRLGPIRSNKKYLIVFTDGIDEGSTVKESDILKLSSDLKIPVFLIIPKAHGHKKMQIKNLISPEIHIFTIDKSDISSDIIDSLYSLGRRSYRLQYNSPVKQDGLEHSIEIKLKTGNSKEGVSGKFTAPRSTFAQNILSDTPTMLLIIAGLIIILLILNIYIIKKKCVPILQTRDSGTALPQIKTAESESLIPIEEEDIQYIEKNKQILSEESPAVYSETWLIEKNGADASKKYPLYRDEISIGKSEKCTIIINENNISPVHARIKRIHDKFYLFDMISEAGTFLNGKKLLRPRAIHDWDEITVGKKNFIFRGFSLKKKE